MSLEAQLRSHRQQRIQGLLAGGGPATPPRLHARIAALQRESRPRPSPARRIAVVAAAGLAAFAAVLVLTIGGSTPGGPTLASAAQLSARQPTEPSPVHDLRRPSLLRERFKGVTYPYWYEQFNWFTAGQRTDDLGGGRTAHTVFYRHTHHRIGYTVVSGKPLIAPRSAERRVVDGLEMRGYRDGDRDVVTFVRNGHTCVLAGMVHSRGTLYKLAAWTGGGELRP
jgi:hypothetical protein